MRRVSAVFGFKRSVEKKAWIAVLENTPHVSVAMSVADGEFFWFFCTKVLYECFLKTRSFRNIRHFLQKSLLAGIFFRFL